jgi:hypothetical protein
VSKESYPVEFFPHSTFRWCTSNNLTRPFRVLQVALYFCTYCIVRTAPQSWHIKSSRIRTCILVYSRPLTSFRIPKSRNVFSFVRRSVGYPVPRICRTRSRVIPNLSPISCRVLVFLSSFIFSYRFVFFACVIHLSYQRN